MPFSHGRAGGLTIADASTTKRNISQYCNSVDFSQSADTADVTTFNTTGRAKVYVPGNKDATFSVEGKYDSTVDGYLNGILGLSKTYTYYANSTVAAGNASFVRYTGSAICTSYGTNTNTEGEITWSAEFQNTGKITRSTASS